MMQRRSFITALLATAALDPERLLWVPGQKSIFIPPVRIPTANEIFQYELEHDCTYWIHDEYGCVVCRPWAQALREEERRDASE